MSHKIFQPCASLFLALIICLAGVSSALAAAGALDQTFGTGGKVATDFGGSEFGRAVAIQLDGKIIMAGSNFNGIDDDFALARYNSDGTLDTTFDIDGKVTTDFTAKNDDNGLAITLQPDGKIIAAGESFNASYDFALARYNSDGTLDTTFDTDGKVTTDFGTSYDAVFAIALQPDGKIVAVGDSDVGGVFHFALARYNSDGSLDTTFDTDGKVTTDFGNGPDGASAVALQPDGKIVVAGGGELGILGFALARYNSDGSLDTTFDTDGKVTTNFGGGGAGGSAITLQPDGKIIVAGASNADFALARYNSDGSLDTTFDTDGKVTTDFGSSFDYGFAATLQSDGKIIVAGASNDDFALARYNNNGSLDTTFDADGKVTTDFGNSFDSGSAITLQTDGKIIVAGTSRNGNDSNFALARYDVETSVVEVSIDVKPGRPLNHIELEKKVCKDDDNLRVAILTTSSFDASTVDDSTLKLGDPSLIGVATPVRSRVRDVDGDGDDDLILSFKLCDLVTNEALNTSSVELVITGKTLDGIDIIGKDSVKVVRDND